MPIEILMPALSPTMTEGNLAKWHVKVGDAVSAGDVIAEIETDKATMEVEAVDEGRIAKILIDEGAEAVPVNQLIALLLEDGEDDSAVATYAANAPPAAAAAPETTPATAPAPQATAQQPAAPRGNGAGGQRVFASPLARRIAGDSGLDISAIGGSGPHARIVKRDVEAAIASGATRAAPAAKPGQAIAIATNSVDAAAIVAQAGGLSYAEIPHTGMRKTIARRLQQSKQQVPHFYLTIDCRIDDLLRVRKQLNGRSDDYKLSVNDFVIRAAAIALGKVPEANATWSDEAILQWDSVDVSVAVAIDGGLITPIVKNADRKGLAQISNDMKDLARRAKDGKLQPAEYQGGTFSISNLGMFGIREFSAIINPPQGGILAVGAGEQRPVVIDGALAVATVMTCTLSCDHRVVDGAVGARFLAEFKKLIEDPLTMLL